MKTFINSNNIYRNDNLLLDSAIVYLESLVVNNSRNRSFIDVDIYDQIPGGIKLKNIISNVNESGDLTEKQVSYVVQSVIKHNLYELLGRFCSKNGFCLHDVDNNWCETYSTNYCLCPMNVCYFTRPVGNRVHITIRVRWSNK